MNEPKERPDAPGPWPATPKVEERPIFVMEQQGTDYFFAVGDVVTTNMKSKLRCVSREPCEVDDAGRVVRIIGKDGERWYA